MLISRTFLSFAAASAAIIAAMNGAANADSAPETTISSQPRSTGAKLGMRRLTRQQYKTAIADVFGNDVEIKGRLDVDVREEGLLAVGSSKAGVSPAGAEYYAQLAKGIASQVVATDRRARLPCQPRTSATFDASCGRKILEEYSLRLFRRPVDASDLNEQVALAGQSARRLGGFYEGIEVSLVGLLVSPKFLFIIDQTTSLPNGALTLDAYSRASRLSFLLWNSGPDDELLRAARAGELLNNEGLAKQVDRMIASPRLRDGVRSFFGDMYGLDAHDDLTKDTSIYPGFTPSVSKAAPEEVFHLIISKLIDEKADYRTLFSDTEAFVSRDLSPLYNVPVASDSGWDNIDLSKKGRAGILTTASFLALHSPPGRSSPTLRGKAIRELFLCQSVPPPPGNIDFSKFEAAVSTATTARQRLAVHAGEPACAGCHRLMDPLGLALENFDGIGQYRTTEGGAIIDPSGDLDGKKFNSAAELGKVLSENPALPDCLVSRTYSYGTGQSISRGERLWVRDLSKRFAANGYLFPELLRVLATSEAFYTVYSEKEQTAQRTALPAVGRFNSSQVRSVSK